MQSYLRNVCGDAGGVYPKDLHFSSERGSNNGQIVKEVKTIFGETIKEFLEEGTWRSYDFGFEPRKGKYYVFASLRGEHGKVELLAKNVSEAIREDFASNLYLHMEEDVVERMLFHNPIMQERMDDIEKRYGRYPDAIRRRNLEIKDYFEKKLGYSIEHVIKGEIEDWL